MKSVSNYNRDAIADEAAVWYVQNRGGPLDRQERAAFVTWLKASPVHVEEYLAVAVVARDLPEAAGDPAVDIEALLAAASGEADNVVPLGQRQERPVPAQPRSRPHAGHFWPQAAAAAALVLAVAAGAIWFNRDGERFGLPRSYTTARAEQRVQQLPDGSILHLNTDSEVTVRYTRGERVIRVDRGQAYFEVTHDGERQFRVDAGGAGVIAVGTQFDVYRRQKDVLVTVIDGSVQVVTGAPPAVETRRVDSGYQIRVSDRLGVPRRLDARMAIAWLRRQIAFEDQPLGEVAAEFNRYGPVVFEIDDASVRDLPISGVFDAYDGDSFAAFLETLQGVVVQRTPSRIRVRGLAGNGHDHQAAVR